MRAWTVDADDILVAEDFDESLRHRTPEIDGFLNPDRDDKFIAIGSTGFGKTLLLKAKRILYQRQARPGSGGEFAEFFPRHDSYFVGDRYGGTHE